LNREVLGRTEQLFVAYRVAARCVNQALVVFGNL